jgi:hypothetical protein
VIVGSVGALFDERRRHVTRFQHSITTFGWC